MKGYIYKNKSPQAQPEIRRSDLFNRFYTIITSVGERKGQIKRFSDAQKLISSHS